MSQLPEEAVITSSIATKHYGVSCYNFYEENEDAGEKKIWNKYEHINQVSKMTWYINIVYLSSVCLPLSLLSNVL